MSVRLPLFDWLSTYRAAWLRPDILAGLTTAAVVIPKAMAYATVAGLPIEIGIYTAIVPALVYVVLGTSRVLSVTTTTTIAILVGAQLAAVVPDADPVKLQQALATLALMVGAVLTLASMLRLGFFADFLLSSAGGFQGRHRFRDHRRPGAQTIRLQDPQGRFFPRRLVVDRILAQDNSDHGRNRPGLDRGARADQEAADQMARSPDRARRGHRRSRCVESAEQRGLGGRCRAVRIALVQAAGPVVGAGHVAGRA